MNIRVPEWSPYALAAAIVLALLAAWEPAWLLDIDEALGDEVQGWGVPGERLSDWASAATTTQVVVVCGYVAAVVLFVLGMRREAVVLAAGMFLLPFAQHWLKELVDRPRPAPALLEHRAGFESASFPAGHVMSPTVLYGFLLVTVQRNRVLSCLLGPALSVLRLGAIGLLAMAGLGQLWLGVHWPSDVAGGYAWGAVGVGVMLVGVELLRRGKIL
jgi:undecaprenyl-diphosphatase